MPPTITADNDRNMLCIIFNAPLDNQDIQLIERAIYMTPEFADTRRPYINPMQGIVKFRYSINATAKQTYDNLVHNLRCILTFAPFIDSLEDKS